MGWSGLLSRGGGGVLLLIKKACIISPSPPPPGLLSTSDIPPSSGDVLASQPFSLTPLGPTDAQGGAVHLPHTGKRYSNKYS